MFDLGIAWYRVIAYGDVPCWIIVAFHNGCAVEFTPGSIGQPGLIYAPARVAIEQPSSDLNPPLVGLATNTTHYRRRP